MKALLHLDYPEKIIIEAKGSLDKYIIKYVNTMLGDTYSEIESEKMYNDFLTLGELIEQQSRVCGNKTHQPDIKSFLLDCFSYSPKIEQYIVERLGFYGMINLPINQEPFYLIDLLEYCYRIYLLRYLFRLKYNRTKSMPKLFKWAGIDLLDDKKMLDSYIVGYAMWFEEVSVTTRLEPSILYDYDTPVDDIYGPNIDTIDADILKVWNRFIDPINYEVQEMIKTQVSTEYRNDETIIIEKHCQRCGRLIKMTPHQKYCNPDSILIDNDEERLLAQTCFNKAEAKRKAEEREKKKDKLNK